jgi:hypothetical protein
VQRRLETVRGFSLAKVPGISNGATYPLFTSAAQKKDQRLSNPIFGRAKTPQEFLLNVGLTAPEKSRSFVAGTCGTLSKPHGGGSRKNW